MYQILIHLAGIADMSATEPISNKEEATHLFESIQQWFDDRNLTEEVVIELVS